MAQILGHGVLARGRLVLLMGVGVPHLVSPISGLADKPQTPQQTMVKQKKRNSYKIGRRLVKGPRPAVGSQAAADDKCATGVPNPIPPKKTQRSGNGEMNHHSFNVVQINICGISNKKTELAHVLSQHKVHVALLQETQHTPKTDLHITGYTPYPCKCDNCQGIITYIKNDVHGDVTKINTAQPTDVQLATAWHSGKKYTIFNVYNPPANNLNSTFINNDVYHQTLLAGDFNGHSPLWGYQDTNNTGHTIEDICNSTNLCILQDTETPFTLLHRAHNTLSRPDLTFLSSDLLQKYKMDVLDCIGSDHRPILITIDAHCDRKFAQRTRWNFKKADWTRYKKVSDELLETVERDTPIDDQCKAVNEAILKAASLCIPRGCRKRYKPFWNDTIDQAVKTRQAARKALETDPTTEKKIEYNHASAKVKRTIKEAKREKWNETCANLDLRKEGAKAWSLLNNLNGEKRRQNPKPLSGDETIADDQKKAESFNKFFASVNKADKLREEDRERIKDLKHKEKAPSANLAIFEEAFSVAELSKALKKLRARKSPGPDNIHNEMLTHLGTKGKQVILHLINTTWNAGTLPTTWKNAFITPIKKKGKPAEELKSFRPINLTSCLGKLAERMVNSRLYWWLETTGILNVNQAGFRRGQRTEDQLFRLCQNIVDGFQRAENTTAVFIDLQQAYDRVWRKGLLWKMMDMGIHGKLYQWVKHFLIDRTTQTKINHGISSKAVQEEGLPQGSSLSCTLFLIFINDLPDTLHTEKALYADDLAMWHTTKHIGISARRLNEDLERLDKYCQTWKLKINYSKTVYSVFTKSNKTAKQKIRLELNKKEILKEDTPTYLGVKLDRQLSLKEHIFDLKARACKRLLLLKRLSGTTWGADKNALRLLYTGYVRSLIEYNLALQSSCSKTTQNLLDKVQNEAVHFISGGMRSTPTAACEIHTNLEPLKFRREAAAMDMVERYRRADKNHPNRKLVDTWRPNNRIQQKSILSFVNESEEKHHLPSNREPIRPIPKEIPPNSHISRPKIFTNLMEPTSKKHSDPIDMKATAERTINTYPDDWVHVYTDGSAFKGTINGGYGAKIQYPEDKIDELFNACGAHCSNFDAEAIAIEAAAHHISSVYTLFPERVRNVVFFSDSKSVLQSLESESLDTESIRSLYITLDSLITTHEISVTLQWIPGHTNIRGNERADKLAKKGATQEQSNLPSSYETARRMIRQNLREEWLNEWAGGKTGRPLYTHMAQPNPKDSINSLERRDQTTIFRLRTHHAPLNAHLHRIKPTILPDCPLCNATAETTHHLLFECPPLKDLREKFLPPSPDPQNTLYAGSQQLKQTCSFFAMAMRQRARAQMTAGSDK